MELLLTYFNALYKNFQDMKHANWQIDKPTDRQTDKQTKNKTDNGRQPQSQMSIDNQTSRGHMLLAGAAPCTDQRDPGESVY